MKKIIAAFAFMLSVGLANAQTDSSRNMTNNAPVNGSTKYEYYPDANVYYNDASKIYWYQDSTSSKWQSAPQLPQGYSVGENSKKNSFYYNGGDVWKANADHVKMYGNGNRPKKAVKDSI